MIRCLLLCLTLTLTTAAAKPNIVFFLVDDMGIGDLACYGAPDAKTPRIDALASEGVTFRNAYAMGPECTPSRTSILTGRYPQRVGGLECAIGTGNVGRYDDAARLAEDGELGLPATRAVLAPALKRAGYHNAIFGKWHLGYPDHFSPLDQGFHEFTGFLGGNVDYFEHVELSPIDVYLKGRETIDREGYTTHLITEDAVGFLEQQSKKPDEPFFLYLPHATPHFPFQAPDSDPTLPTADEWMSGTRETYVKMIEDMDAAVGEVLDALETHGMAEETIVVFASDHGAMLPGRNEPYRDFKGTLFEGGLRVPLMVRWSGEIDAGVESGQVVTLMDLTNSFLRITGQPAPDGASLDGFDLIHHVTEGKKDVPRTLFWRARRGDRTWWAVRDGDHKWLRKVETEAGTDESWLFDLKADPYEATNLDNAAKVKTMREKLTAWEEEMAAEMR